MSKRSALLLVAIMLYTTITLCETPPKIVTAARSQIGTTLYYDSSYRTLAYPNGDVPVDRGVCSDVIIRALRTAHGFDLQQQIQEDMQEHFSLYPSLWGSRHPDRNIDHRRVPNLQTFFQRKGWSLPISNNAKDYLPGDIITTIVPPNLPHIMIVSDRTSFFGRPLVIHNIGSGTQEEDVLFDFKITGHYRITKLN